MEPFVRLTASASKLSPGTRVLKAGDYLVQRQAKQMLDDARSQADALVEQARDEFERQKELGYQEGETNARMEAAEHILDTVGQAVDYFARVEHAVADVVMSSVRKIVADFDDVELSVRVARNALEVVRDQRQVTLRVAPGDETAVRDRIGELLSGYPGISYLEVVPDHRLSGGDCMLDSELGVVDASIEVQLKALENALRSRIGAVDEGTT